MATESHAYRSYAALPENNDYVDVRAVMVASGRAAPTIKVRPAPPHPGAPEEPSAGLLVRDLTIYAARRN